LIVSDLIVLTELSS